MGQPYFHWETLWDILSLYRNSQETFFQRIIETSQTRIEFVWTGCSVLVLAHGTTRLPQIPSESMCFQWIRWTPSDDFLTILKVSFTLPDSSGLDCTSGFICRLDSIELQDLSTGIQQRVLEMNTKYHNIQTSLTSTYIECVEDMLQITRDYECHCCLILC